MVPPVANEELPGLAVVHDHWQGLEPSHRYARVGRPLLNALLVACTLPTALLCALLIVPVNWAIFGDWRRILFVQPRVGYRGKIFSMFKFRTMREPSRTALASWSSNEDWARVTPFGRFLRSTHLDELPQLLNILRGEMNVIGPRPEMIEIESWASEHVPGFWRRLALRPGVTGLAQITQGYTGRDVEAYARKLAINEHYREHLSLGMDCGIIAHTLLWMLRGKGWHWRQQASVAARTACADRDAAPARARESRRKSAV